MSWLGFSFKINPDGRVKVCASAHIRKAASSAVVTWHGGCGSADGAVVLLVASSNVSNVGLARLLLLISLLWPWISKAHSWSGKVYSWHFRRVICHARILTCFGLKATLSVQLIAFRFLHCIIYVVTVLLCSFGSVSSSFTLCAAGIDRRAKCSFEEKSPHRLRETSGTVFTFQLHHVRVRRGRDAWLQVQIADCSFWSIKNKEIKSQKK